MAETPPAGDDRLESGKKAVSDTKLQALVVKYADVTAYQIAQAYAFQGQRDRAFEWLDRAVAQRDGGMSMVKTDPLFRPLHADARWPAFLRKFGLHDEQVADLR